MNAKGVAESCSGRLVLRRGDITETDPLQQKRSAVSELRRGGLRSSNGRRGLSGKRMAVHCGGLALTRVSSKGALPQDGDGYIAIVRTITVRRVRDIFYYCDYYRGRRRGPGETHIDKSKSGK